jgi:DNA-binding CsgD family transcriptional regulator
MTTINTTNHQFKDPAGLTSYEARIWELHKQGLNPKEISDAMGGTSSPVSIQSRMRVIREKVALKEITDAQSRRLYWG